MHIKWSAVAASRLVLAAFVLLAALSALFPPTTCLASAPGGTLFEPHGYCLLWEPSLLWLHVGTDLLIGLAYVAIAASLTYLVWKAGAAIPYPWMVVAFSTFIIASGATHFMAVWNIWSPYYWASGSVKVVTALASVVTAVALPPLIPRILHTAAEARLSQERKAHLERANAELQELYARTQEVEEQLKTELFANVSHELRTPLTLIKGPVQRLLARQDLTPEQRRELQVVERNTLTLAEHVETLLEVSQLNAGKVRIERGEIDLARLVRITASHFELLARDQQVSLTVDTPPSLPARVDPPKMQRILLNLIGNAFKFTPPGGRIRVALKAADGRALLSVADTGPGVPPRLRNMIFERFRQADSGTAKRYGGMGLGLAIVREFTELHNGTVSVADAPEGGALFEVSLPLWHASTEPDTAVAAALQEWQPHVEHFRPMQRPPEPEPVFDADPDRPLVLIVEDHPEMNRYLVDLLQPHYRTLSAYTGAEALTLVDAQPDLILTDVAMESFSGEQLITRLRTDARLDATPVLVVSARADEESRVRLIAAGAQDYVTKPFSATELLLRIRNLITLKRARDVMQAELHSQTENLDELATELASQTRRLQTALDTLRATESKVNQLINTNLIGVIVADLRGRVLEANDAFLAMVGYSREDLASGACRWDHMTPEEWLPADRAAIASLVATGACTPYEKEYIRKDGARVPVLLGVAFLEGSTDTCVCFALDLTRTKAIETALRQALQTRDEFMAIAAHELKTPLTSLKGLTQLTLRRLERGRMPSPDELMQTMQAIHGQAAKLAQLASQLLDVARLESGRLQLQRQEVDLRALIQAVTESAQVRAAGHHLRVRTPKTPVPVAIDPVRMEQVLTNLLDNAIRFSPPDTGITVELAADASAATIIVSDEGPGIPPEHHAHIFDRFYRVKTNEYQAGLGLGLYISRQIVEAHGGTIALDPSAETGARFCITLPFLPPYQGV